MVGDDRALGNVSEVLQLDTWQLCSFAGRWYLYAYQQFVTPFVVWLPTAIATHSAGQAADRPCLHKPMHPTAPAQVLVLQPDNPMHVRHWRTLMMRVASAISSLPTSSDRQDCVKCSAIRLGGILLSVPAAWPLWYFSSSACSTCQPCAEEPCAETRSKEVCASEQGALCQLAAGCQRVYNQKSKQSTEGSAWVCSPWLKGPANSVPLPGEHAGCVAG